jgi:FkbM family methyltransferase
MFYTSLRAGRRRTIVQVGAYTGDDTLIALCRRRGHRLFMFEPNPRRAADLRQKAAPAGCVEVIEKAVSDFNGSACFNIAAYDDCSSLLEFSPDANRTWVHEWHPYKRFDTVDRIDVGVIRLDTFMAERGLATIDLLEVDAQGADLQVVRSLGDRIRDVRRIQIEVNIHSAPLYENSFGLDDALQLFGRHGFEQHVQWRQSLNREANIIFRNRRFYPNPLFNRIASVAEQQARQAYYAWLKLPRVLAVTGTMLRRRVLGGTR